MGPSAQDTTAAYAKEATMMKTDYTANDVDDIEKVLSMMRFVAEAAVKSGPVKLMVEVLPE
jgi:hypothetical protein